jgi:hypothetical protein
MKKLLTVLFFSWAFTMAQAQTTDNQLWTAFQAQTDITKRLTLGLDLEVRFDNDISRLRSVFGQAEVSWKFSKYLSAAIDYRYGGRQNETLSEFSKGHRISLFVTGKYKFHKFTISDRLGYYNQYLVDAPEDKVNPEKYVRNKTQLRYDLTKKLSPLVYFEFFYRLSGNVHEVDENRFAAGFEYDLNKKNSVKLLYMYLTEVNVKPKNKDDRNIISVAYNLKF